MRSCYCRQLCQEQTELEGRYMNPLIHCGSTRRCLGRLPRPPSKANWCSGFWTGGCTQRLGCAGRSVASTCLQVGTPFSRPLQGRGQPHNHPRQHFRRDRLLQLHRLRQSLGLCHTQFRHLQRRRRLRRPHLLPVSVGVRPGLGWVAFALLC